MSFALFGIAVPNFWFALLLILGFGLYLGWFPTLGYVDPSVNFGMFLWYLTLPAIVLGTDMASTVTRYVRAEMLEQLKLDYVRTARAKGVARRSVVYKHTLRNSLIAATTVIGLQVGRLLGGSTVVETIFAWPGVGRLVLEAVYARDYPLLQGAVLFLACTYVVVNLFVDVLYKWLDPRISLSLLCREEASARWPKQPLRRFPRNRLRRGRNRAVYSGVRAMPSRSSCATGSRPWG